MSPATPARRVRHLHLTAPDEALLRRGEWLVADAFHTASLPAERAGRLVLVRRLDLGLIDSRASPYRLALKIEQECEALSGAGVAGDLPEAASAPAVIFQDRLEAICALALKLSRAGRAPEWFWPLAVPGWQDGLPLSESMRVLAAAALAEPGGAHALARLVQVLAAQNAADALLAALRTEDGPLLLERCGWCAPSLAAPSTAPSMLSTASAASETPEAAGSLPPAPGFSPAWAQLLAAWSARWGAQDDRTTWLAAVALLPATGTPPGAAVAAWARRAVTALAQPKPGAVPAQPLNHAPAVPENATGESRAPSPPPQAASGAELADQEGQPARGIKAGPAAAPRPGKSHLPAGGVGAGRPPAGEIPAACAPARPSQEAASSGWLDGSLATPAAGLFLLLPLLGRLGLGAFRQAHPALDGLPLADLILRRAAASTQVAADDAIFALLSPPVKPDALTAFCAPDLWRQGLAARGLGRLGHAGDARVLYDGTGRLALAAWPGSPPPAVRAWAGWLRSTPVWRPQRPPLPDPVDPLDCLAGAWLLAARRWLGRYAGLSLIELVARPGQFLATPTHLDVFFALHLAEIRVRKAGLDLDPGWLPWWGRVVSFHYL
jgi:hypothetical protein